MDVILTNPPFGGEEEAGILNNFPDDRRTTETALLFLQVIMRRLKRGGHGRAAVVVPNGTLFGDGVAARIKAELLEHFNLHTIVRLPEGVFAPYTDIPVNLIFFDTSGPTGSIWYYEQPLPDGRRRYTKTAPMVFDELGACLAWWRDREPNERAWQVDGANLIHRDDDGQVIGCNLDVKNPHEREPRTTGRHLRSSMQSSTQSVALRRLWTSLKTWSWVPCRELGLDATRRVLGPIDQVGGARTGQDVQASHGAPVGKGPQAARQRARISDGCQSPSTGTRRPVSTIPHRCAERSVWTSSARIGRRSRQQRLSHFRCRRLSG